MIWKIWKNYIKNILQQQEKDTPLQTLGIVGSVRGSDSGSVVVGGDGVTVVVDSDGTLGNIDSVGNGSSAVVSIATFFWG